ncbi:PIG-L deacetylase family protein [Streptosporangium oxazolinicum]
MMALSAGEQVLVIAPHADDETLGAGGTIARFVEYGLQVHVLAIGCGVTGEGERLAEFGAACDALGVTGRAIAWPGVSGRDPAGRARDLVELIEFGAEMSLRALSPAALLIPVHGSFHQDHRAVHQAAIAAARPVGNARPKPRIVLGYAGPEDRTWGSGRSTLNVHVDTTSVWASKEKALGCYISQMRDPSHPRSIERVRAIDTAGGAAIGSELAESFVAYRMAF